MKYDQRPIVLRIWRVNSLVVLNWLVQHALLFPEISFPMNQVINEKEIVSNMVPVCH